MRYRLDPVTGKLQRVHTSNTSVIVGGRSRGSSSTQSSTPANIESLTDLTKQEILATAPSKICVAVASDTEEFFFWDGTSWRVAPLELDTISGQAYIGAFDSDKQGYTREYISNKALHNMVLLGSTLTTNGGIRIDTSQTPNRLQVYLRDQWNTIYEDFTTENGDLRHTPASRQIYVWRGDSVDLGLNGRPVVSEYRTCIGAFPPAVIIDGGSF